MPNQIENRKYVKNWIFLKMLMSRFSLRSPSIDFVLDITSFMLESSFDEIKIILNQFSKENIL